MQGEGGTEIVEGKFRKLVLFQDAPVGMLGDREEAGGPQAGPTQELHCRPLS